MQNVHFLCHGYAAGPVGQTKSPRSAVGVLRGLVFGLCRVRPLLSGGLPGDADADLVEQEERQEDDHQCEGIARSA